MRRQETDFISLAGLSVLVLTYYFRKKTVDELTRKKAALISVSGKHTEKHHPQRATLHIKVSHKGSSKQEVGDAVTSTTAQEIFPLLQQYTAAGLSKPREPVVEEQSFEQSADIGNQVPAITSLKSGSLTTHTLWQWNEVTRKSDICVHEATLSVSVEFADFSKLNDVVYILSTKEHINLSPIRWALLPSQRELVREMVQTNAVREAVLKAERYAHALDYSNTRCIELSDPEVGSARPPGYGAPGASLMMAKSAGGDTSGVQVTPEEIEISATVHAKFSAW